MAVEIIQTYDYYDKEANDQSSEALTSLGRSRLWPGCQFSLRLSWILEVNTTGEEPVPPALLGEMKVYLAGFQAGLEQGQFRERLRQQDVAKATEGEGEKS